MLVTPTCVIPIEFKVGAKKFERLDIEQAWDFRLDIKNFHAPSHAAAIFPLLCATDAAGGRPTPTASARRFAAMPLASAPRSPWR